ncbi:MAG: efflux RND transporter permease subunit [Candidatus Gracilibacteria bacterium]|nr:efflux RND transporter permease subunit [Candidatus Gracilibacteria bacterium]
MSLGGIAIAIGTMVDAAIVVTENAYNKLLQQEEKNVSSGKERIIPFKQRVEIGFSRLPKQKK